MVRRDRALVEKHLLMMTRCEALGEEGHMLGAGRCEWYAGGAGGVGMQGDAERAVKIDRASCASEGERTDPGRRDGGGGASRENYAKIDGSGGGQQGRK